MVGELDDEISMSLISMVVMASGFRSSRPDDGDVFRFPPYIRSTYSGDFETNALCVPMALTRPS